MNSHTAVKVRNQDHPRHGQAGHTVESAEAGADAVTVKFDDDNEVETVLIEDLEVLGG